MQGKHKYAAVRLTNDVYIAGISKLTSRTHIARATEFALHFQACRDLEDSEWIVAALTFTLVRLPDDVEIYIHIVVMYYDSAN